MKKLLIWLCVGMLAFGMVGCGSQGDDKDTYRVVEMTTIKDAIVGELGENYWPSMPLDSEMLEGWTGVAPDMYEDFLAEIPMISTNVDTLIVVRAKEDQAEAVEKALNDYRDANVSNTMQYPQNIGKIQASKVERLGNYVIYVQLGGDVMDIIDQGDEAVIVHCQEVNDRVIDIIKETIR